jgi:hypothetical protein
MTHASTDTRERLLLLLLGERNTKLPVQPSPCELVYI